ncbi:MAG: heat-shock protein [Gammaproteobacteria bacterium RIFCSPHIGHO2_12_FULL_63_22]|nr:MAG: heat-shock protein [Gammaproteobacteria bacterium RIFCSPHIGHO2_12_FULL_63_22]
MRPLPTLSLILLAALGGGVAARLFTLGPADDGSPEALVQTAASAALPALASAAPPTPVVGGAPMPTLAPMLERVTPAVVNIYTKQVVRVNNPLAEFFGGGRFPQERVQQSLGSGVIVDATRGLILTNNHVVEGADAVSVTLSDGRTFEAEPIGSDADTDVAVIRITAPKLTAIPLADSSALRVGDYVVAVGNPFGLGQTVTSGIVSAVGRSGLSGLGYQNFIQTDASINPGNSGGALVNLRGELVGINAATYNPRGSGAGNIGLSFAIPVNLAREVMRQLMAYGEVRRGSLGLETPDMTAALAKQFDVDINLRGALVRRVYRGSPAEVAGVQPGDVIVAVNGQRIDSGQGLHNMEGLLPVGQPVKLDLQRDGRLISTTATLKALSKEVEGATLDPRLAGATFTDLPERYRQQGMNGVIISKVAPGSRAARNQLDGGDLVLAVNRRVVVDLNAFRAQMSPPPKNLVLALQRGGARGELPMQ